MAQIWATWAVFPTYSKHFSRDLVVQALRVGGHDGVDLSKGMTSATTSRLILSRRSLDKSRKSKFRIWKPATPAVEVVQNLAVLPQRAERAVVLGKSGEPRAHRLAASPRLRSAPIAGALAKSSPIPVGLVVARASTKCVKSCASTFPLGWIPARVCACPVKAMPAPGEALLEISTFS